MTIQEAMDHRRSRRSYTTKPLSAETVHTLQTLLTQLSQAGNLDMRMVLGDGSAWNGLRNSYGMFSGVEHYVGLICDPSDALALEKLGYYGELWVLHATTLGLGTCWVGGTFRRELCPFVLQEPEMVACTIAFGHVTEKLGGKEALIRRIARRKTKPLPEMTRSDGSEPKWFSQGMLAVQKAPSAVNRQPVTFSVESGVVSASVPDLSDVGTALDFGIAKQHFLQGVGFGRWDWGNGGVFHPEGVSGDA